MSQCVELLTAALTALTELFAVTNKPFDQLSEDRVRKPFRTSSDLAIALYGLSALPPISRQGTPAPLKQNPCFQQLQQRVQILTNQMEAVAEKRMPLLRNAMHYLQKDRNLKQGTQPLRLT